MRQVDYYEVLEVRRTDDHLTIKRSYRRLARRFHPDQNPDNPQAEERFKRIVEAWDVIGDAERRKHYDRWGHQAPFQHGNAPVVVDPVDLLKTAAQQFRARFLRRKGKDLSIDVTLSFKEALLGSTRIFEIPRLGPTGQIERRRFEVQIPRGIGAGRVLRWKGFGAPGAHGGEYGNLLVHVHVEPHPIFRFVRERLFIDVYLTADEAREGCVFDIPSPWGVRTLSVPSRTRAGAVIECPHLGGLNARDLRDSLWVEVHVASPEMPAQTAHAFATARARFATYVDELRSGQSA